MRRVFVFVALLYIFIPALNAQVTPKQDTLEIDGVMIIRDNGVDTMPHTEKKSFFKKFSTSTNPKNIKTEWGIVDIGISNYVDNTVYENANTQAYAPGANKSWTQLKPGKSQNVNIWIVMQQYNIIRHYVNLRYGLGLELNNYSYKQPIRYTAQTEAVQNAPVIFLDDTPNRTYRKDKLAADYVTIPAMLNFNLTPYRLYPFEVSAGVSVGYLYTARNKAINSDEGKTKTRGDFDLRPWKLSYIGEINLGIIRLYGSYAFKSMYQRGLDITPYSFGIRIRPLELLGKIETR